MPAPYLDHPPTAAGPSLLPSSASIVCGSISVFAGQEELLEGQSGLGPLKAKMDIEDSTHSHQAFARAVPPSTNTVLPLHLTPRSVSGPPVSVSPVSERVRGGLPHTIGMTGLPVGLSSPPTGRTSQAGKPCGQKREWLPLERVFLDAAAPGVQTAGCASMFCLFLDGPHGKLLPLSEPWFSHLYNGLPRTCPHLEGHFCSVKPSGLANGSSGARVPDACSCTPFSASSISPPTLGLAAGPISFTPDGPWGFPRDPLLGKLRPRFMMGKWVGLGPLSRQDSMVLQNKKQIPQPTKMCPLPWRAPGPSPTLWWGWGGQGRHKPASHICG